jgi:hypothetical protein
MRIFPFLLTLALFFSCKDQNSTPSAKLHADSLQIGDNIVYLDSISENDFKKVKNMRQKDNPDTSIVKIFKDSILIRTASKNLVFRNDSSDSDSMATYEFKSIMPDPGYVHIKGFHWEWTTDRFINLKSSVETHFWDNPVLSPDKQKVVAYSCDIEAGFMPNGIQLFKINQDTIINLFEKEIDNWGPEEVKWGSDTSLVIKRLSLDKDMQPKYDYLRFSIK